MGPLKQWVRDIMLILLLAHALELAVPFGASRRYVRLGAGLILLLALLQPMLTFVRADFDAVLLQAADGSSIEAAVEARLGLLQEAQAVTASQLGYRLSEDAVAAVAAEYGLHVRRLELDPSGRVVIWLAAAEGGEGGAMARGRFVSEVAAALGVGVQYVDVRWPFERQEGEGLR